MSEAIDDRAAAGLLALLLGSSRVEKREIIGAVTESGYVLGARQAGETSSGRATLPGDALALYHNHPPGLDNDVFSPHDITVATKLGLPTYIAVQRRGESPWTAEVRKYDPAAPAGTVSKAEGGKFSRGEPVLAQIPIEEIRKLYLAQGILK